MFMSHITFYLLKGSTAALHGFVLFFHKLGEKLLPDYFLEDTSLYSTIASGSSVSDVIKDVADQGSGSEETPQKVFSDIKPLLNETVVSEVGGTFVFKLGGSHSGFWLLDLKNGSGTVQQVEDSQASDVTMEMDSADMVKMFKGEIKPTVAFMSGKLKISGNLQMAMKLEKLMGKLNSKL